MDGCIYSKFNRNRYFRKSKVSIIISKIGKKFLTKIFCSIKTNFLYIFEKHDIIHTKVNFSWKKIQFQLALNKTFCPIPPPPLIDRRFEHRQRPKINKTMLSASSVFHTKFTISVLKSTKVFHPNGNWTQTASVRVLNWVSTFCAATDSEHKFHKTGIEN